ncbi:RNA polymerase II subunit 5-mediating protein homolog isoform X1 [Tanacetum coccineum]
MSNSVKGTVTSLSSLYSPQDTQKASLRVQETISEHHKNIQQLQTFLNENNILINLVKKLPDKLNHDIMASMLIDGACVVLTSNMLNKNVWVKLICEEISQVPFGKAAFFPGKLIHTNEFLVLLGEGYYADRTSKQTVEILKRRGKDLESQIENLNGIIKDLKFEASFFDETATEAAEGIVEIREDYVEETPNEDKATTAGEDDFARILSRMEELEKEELENEELESEVAEEGEDLDTADLSHLMSRTSFETEVRSSELHTDSYVKVPTSSGSEARPRLVEHNKSKNSLPPTPVSKNEVSTLASSSSNDRSKASAIAPVSKEVKHPIHPSLPCTFLVQ